MTDRKCPECGADKAAGGHVHRCPKCEGEDEGADDEAPHARACVVCDPKTHSAFMPKNNPQHAEGGHEDKTEPKRRESLAEQLCKQGHFKDRDGKVGEKKMVKEEENEANFNCEHYRQWMEDELIFYDCEKGILSADKTGCPDTCPAFILKVKS